MLLLGVPGLVIGGGGSPTPVGDNLLLEDGDSLLLETGNALLLETTVELVL